MAKENATHLLLDAGTGCVFDTQLCETLESELRAELTKLIPDVHFVSRDTYLQVVRRRGFLSIDGSNDLLARELASETGAEIVVIEHLTLKANTYELRCYIVRVSGDKEIGSFETKIARSVTTDDDKPILIKDQESGVAFTMFRANALHFPPVYVPHCAACPDPVYPMEARRKGLQGVMVFFVTITVQGTAEQISLVKSFDASLNDNAIQTIKAWHFKPAIGPNGEPFVSRMPLEVTYRLQP